MELPERPVLRCVKHAFGEVAADAALQPWPQLQGSTLHDVVTAGVPVQPATVRAGWDDSELRVLFECVDEHPWATLVERDAPLYREEVVEVFLDPVGDLGAYFELEVNPLNAVLDCVMRQIRSGYRKDFRWRCQGLRTAARVFEGGWSAELAIPFASICGSAPAPGDVWRANFTRIDRPKDKPRELSAWSPTGFAQFHVPQRFGTLRFEG